MKYSEISELATKELLEKITDEENLLNRLRLNHKVSPIENPQKIKETRRQIARLKTELRVREINESQEQQ